MAPVRLSAEDVDRLVDPRGLVEDVAEVLRSAEPVAPPRASLAVGGTWFAAMPAGGMGFYAAKLVGVYPGNPARGLPLVRGVLLLFDAETGELLLEADAGAATGWRTAAATALAVELLGGGRGVLGVVGAGVQADYHIRLLASVMRFSEVVVASRRPESAARLASLRGASPAQSVDEVLRVADTVVLATTSTRPLAEQAREGAVVASVGAPRPVRELGVGLLAEAGCVLVDTVEGFRREAGEYVPGLVEAVGLREALRGEAWCGWKRVGLYKSVGTALLDLAVAIHLYRRLRRQAPSQPRGPGRRASQPA